MPLSAKNKRRFSAPLHISKKKTPNRHASTCYYFVELRIDRDFRAAVGEMAVLKREQHVIFGAKLGDRFWGEDFKFELIMHK